VHLKADKIRTDDSILTLANRRYIDSALEVMGLSKCNPSTSPKVDKDVMPGDEIELEQAEVGPYRTATCKLIYLSRRRWDIQAAVRILCTQLKTPTRYTQRVLIKLLRYLAGTRDLGQRMCIDPDAGTDIEYGSDSDWAPDRVTRRSVSACLIQVEGCTMHGQCRGQDTVATSSTQAEIIAATDGMKEALLTQYLLHFLGMGFRTIRLKLDSSGVVSFTHR
jgi:hypothetical protein